MTELKSEIAIETPELSFSEKYKSADCPICVEKKILKLWVTCPKCSFSCCRDCISRYLLELKDVNPKCMSCPVQWDFEFLADNMDTSFHNSRYRDRRAKLIMERERSLLPATQPLAAEEAKREEKKAEAKEKIKALDAKAKKYQRKLDRAKAEIRKLSHIARTGTVIINITEPQEKKVVQNRFIGHCPEEKCMGYLDVHYECGMCKKKACRSCRQAKHEGKCNSETVETIKLLAKDTKSCPNCSVAIYKIAGCSQMWCTQCHTPFDWETGKIEAGQIHNPHYYQWQNANGGHVPRALGDVRCGGPANADQIYRKLAKIDRDTQRWVANALGMSIHVRRIVLPIFRIEQIEEHTNQDLRIKYLLQQITEEKWLSEIKRREKMREKKQAIGLVLQMFCDTIDDLVNNIVQCKDEEVPSFIAQLKELQTYAEQNFKKIENRFQNDVPVIKNNWAFSYLSKLRISWQPM